MSSTTGMSSPNPNFLVRLININGGNPQCPHHILTRSKEVIIVRRKKLFKDLLNFGFSLRRNRSTNNELQGDH